jgi:hypothetical protein
MTKIQNGTITNAAVTTLEDVAIIEVRGAEVLQFSFVVGSAALTAFDVAGRVGASGGWFTIATAAGDYTTPNHPVLDASGSLVTAAAGATVHWAKIDVRGLESVRLQASSGTSSSIAGHYGTV